MMRPTLLAFALPPVLLLLLAVLGGVLAARGRRWAGAGAAIAALLVLLMATPAVAALLRWSLEREVITGAAPAHPPGAIIVLGAELNHGARGAEPGRLSLMRLREGARLHRATGLPLLVTGGIISAGAPPLATLMAKSLAEDFGTPARWVEPRATDTRENAAFSAALLAQAGIHAAYLVSHGWHLPRARAAFDRAGLLALPIPVEAAAPRPPAGSDWLPRPDHLMESWLALREWAGRLVYALRD
jgi:uncharacterized SAM-binding protein YcdF (DUF218 family)